MLSHNRITQCPQIRRRCEWKTWKTYNKLRLLCLWTSSTHKPSGVISGNEWIVHAKKFRISGLPLTYLSICQCRDDTWYTILMYLSAAIRKTSLWRHHQELFHLTANWRPVSCLYLLDTCWRSVIREYSIRTCTHSKLPLVSRQTSAVGN